MRCWRVELPEIQTGTHNEFQVAECGLKAVKQQPAGGPYCLYSRCCTGHKVYKTELGRMVLFICICINCYLGNN